MLDGLVLASGQEDPPLLMEVISSKEEFDEEGDIMSLHPNLDELLKKRNRTPEEEFLLFSWERLEDWNDTAVYSKVRTLFLSLLDKEAERVMRGVETSDATVEV